jgi:hypothetical protein
MTYLSIYNELNLSKHYRTTSRRYKVSKLLQLYTVREMAGRSPITPDSNAIISYLTSSVCRSEIFRDGASCKTAGTLFMAKKGLTGERRKATPDHEHQNLTDYSYHHAGKPYNRPRR